jgi:parvulin-like peptidyl-prolyl isomerase
MARETAERVTTAMGCNWDVPVPKADPSAAKVALARAHALTKVLTKPGVDTVDQLELLKLRSDESLERTATTPAPALEPEVLRAIDPLRAGELSAPIETTSYVKLVVLLDRWPAGPVPFSSVAERIEQDITFDEDYLEDEVEEDLRRRFKVVVYDRL